MFFQSHQMGVVVKPYNTYQYIWIHVKLVPLPQDDRREHTYFKLTGDGGKEKDLLRAQGDVPQERTTSMYVFDLSLYVYVSYVFTLRTVRMMCPAVSYSTRHEISTFPPPRKPCQDHHLPKLPGRAEGTEGQNCPKHIGICEAVGPGSRLPTKAP